MSTPPTQTFTPYPVVRATGRDGKPVGPIYGIGWAFRPWGDVIVEVKWPGMTMTRRESVLHVERYEPPVPVRQRRTRKAIES